MFRSLTLAALVAFASAQALSTQCITAFGGIAANQEAAACLSTGSLVTALGAGTSGSLVPTINSWLTGVCGSPACSNETLAAVVQNVTAGCGAELGLAGDSTIVPSIVTVIQQYYPTARKVFCLKDGNTNCITQTLTNIEAITGPISLSTFSNVITKLSTAEGLPKNVTCTNCVKAAYNTVVADVPSLVSDLGPTFSEQCGASYIDGAAPAGIQQTASTGSSTSPGNTTSTNPASAASPLLSQGLFSGLAVSAIVSVFAFLA